MKIIPCPPSLKNYPGNKSSGGTYHTIINNIPPHSSYIEACAGSAAIFRYKKPAEFNLLNDINPVIYDAWLTMANTDTFKCKFRNLHLKVSVTPAVQLLSYLVHFRDRDTFIYVDAPYLINMRRSGANYYKHEMTVTDHEEYLTAAVKVNCNCMISHFSCEMYDSILKGWRKLEYWQQTHQGKQKECLYMNYEAPVKLHDYRYLGSDCWDRQRIHRKLERIVNKLSKLPALERAAITDRINTEVK